MKKFYHTFIAFIAFVHFAISTINAQTCPTCVSATSNLIQNPSFELGGSTSLTNWTDMAGTSNTSIRVSGTLVNTCAGVDVCGTYVGAIGYLPNGGYTGAGNGSAYQDITLGAGVAFNFSVYAGRTDAAFTPTIKLRYLNGSNVDQATALQANVTKNAYTSCELQQYTFVGTTPTGTTKVRIELATTGGYLKVDAMCLTVSCKTAVAGPDQEKCNSNSFALAANTPNTGETGTWSIVTGNVNLSSTSSPTATATITSGSTCTLLWTISRGTNGQFCSNFDEITLSNNPNPTATAVPTNITCHTAANGSIALTAASGTPAYTYLWSNAATDKDITGLSPGTYSVTVTDSKGCTATTAASITEPAALSVAIVASDVTCYQSNNGALDVTITGGTNPVTVAWSNTATTEDLTNLGPGTYTVTVTDAKGCTATALGTVLEPTQLMFTATAVQLLCGETTGSATLGTPTGGVAPYTINAAAVPITGLLPGTYTYLAADANNCTATASVTIDDLPTTPPTVNAGADAEVCAHVADEELTDNSPGLTKVKTYQLSGTATGASSVLWSDGGAGGVFDDATKLNAIYTPPILPSGVTTVVLTLTTNDPDGPCGPVSDQMTLTEIPCAGILDPCTCNDVLYAATEVLEVKDFIEIDGTPGQTWTIIANGGGVNTANGGLPFGTMQLLDASVPLTTTNVDVPIGTLVPEVSPGKYIYNFAHDSGKGYTVTVQSNTGIVLSISNYCIINTFTPTTQVDANYCVTTYAGGPITLTADEFDLGATSAGSVKFYWVNGANQEVELVNNQFDPLDPQFTAPSTIKIVAKYVPNPGNVLDCLLTKDATGAITLSTCALDVTLERFEAKVLNSNVVLNWKTSNEKDFDRFQIERSSNSQEFSNIASVKANNAGFYSTTDFDPIAGNNYYRLKMIDNNGSFTYSKIVSVNTEKDKFYAHVVNPSVAGKVQVQTNIENPNIEIYDQSGKKLNFTSLRSSKGQYELAVSQPNAGLYLVKIMKGNYQFTKKVYFN
jgi:hypothetical protein